MAHANEFPKAEATPDNVVKVNFSTIGLTVERAGSHCMHNQATINENARTVKCKACGALLDPISVLVKMARRADMLRWTIAEENRVAQRILLLKHEEYLIKARIKSAKRRAPGAD